MKCNLNFSADKYLIFSFGLTLFFCHAIACIKWVLPNPTPPYKNKGLNGTSCESATLLQAEKANSLDFPTTKSLNVNRGSKLFSSSLLLKSYTVSSIASWFFLFLHHLYHYYKLELIYPWLIYFFLSIKIINYALDNNYYFFFGKFLANIVLSLS